MMVTFIGRNRNPLVNKPFHLAIRFFRELITIHHTCGKQILFLYLFAILASIHRIALSASLKPADDLMTGKTIHLTSHGKKIVIDGKNFGLIREIFCSKCYFPPLDGFVLKRGDTVVDLGCNVGVFTLLAAKTANHVIAVDALSQFLPELENNLRFNDCLDKVSIQLALVGSSRGVFAEKKQLQNSPYYSEAPSRLSMNQICRIYRVERIDFLKVDIEGSEFDLFSVNNEWLECVRTIAMEIHQHFGETDSIIKLLRRSGFQVWLRDKNGYFVDKLMDPIGYMYAIKEKAMTSTKHVNR